MMATPTLYTDIRSLSLHERFSVARRNCGFPHYVVYLLSYPTDRLPSVEALSSRIDDLQKHFPLLHSIIIEGQTKNPAFQLREQWGASDILSTLDFTPEHDELKERTSLLKAEIDRVQLESKTSKPLWQVTRYTHPSSTRAYLSLFVDHVLTDGRGGLNLLQALLAPSIDHLPFETITAISKLEDTHNTKPSASYLIPMAFQELLVPRLPTFLQRYLKPNAPWPSGTTIKSPLECPGEISILTLSPDILSNLKTAGKANGVQTLHPILKLSYGIAIWAVHSRTATSNDRPFSLSLQTPSSVRDPSKNHSYCTANYTASNTLTFLPTPNSSFWVEARKIATNLNSQNAKSQALQSMGLLAYLPDPDPEPNTTPLNPEEPTGWETYLLNKAKSGDPFPGSLGFSNLGFVELPEGAVDWVWSQVVSPFAPVYEVNVGSCARGLRAVSIWREGSATTRKEVEEVERVWERVLIRLGEGGGEVTLGELVG